MSATEEISANGHNCQCENEEAGKKHDEVKMPKLHLDEALADHKLTAARANQSRPNSVF
jgi:phage terminase Nu1 subunit (DNA packaging protein)